MIGLLMGVIAFFLPWKTKGLLVGQAMPLASRTKIMSILSKDPVVEKIYDVKVEGHFTMAGSQAIAKGIKLEDGAIGKGKVEIIGRVKSDTNI